MCTESPYYCLSQWISCSTDNFCAPALLGSRRVPSHIGWKRTEFPVGSPVVKPGLQANLVQPPAQQQGLISKFISAVDVFLGHTVALLSLTRSSCPISVHLPLTSNLQLASWGEILPFPSTPLASFVLGFILAWGESRFQRGTQKHGGGCH